MYHNPNVSLSRQSGRKYCNAVTAGVDPNSDVAGRFMLCCTTASTCGSLGSPATGGLCDAARHNKTENRENAAPQADVAEAQQRAEGRARHGSSATDLQKQLDQRTRERDEALEREAATAQVLRVISSSSGELELVFQTMLQNATRICDAKFGALYLSEGNDVFRTVAMHNAPLAFAEMRRRNPVFRADPRMALARAATTRQPVQIADVQAEPGYFDPLPGFSGSQIAALAGGRTVLAVPLLKEGKLAGAIGIYRQEMRPFSDRQI